MEPVLIAENRIDAWIDALIAAGRVVAPVRHGSATHWRVVNAANEVDLGYGNTVDSPKAFFFPAAERLLAYERVRGDYNAVTATGPDAVPTVLLGVRPLRCPRLVAAGRRVPGWPLRRPLLSRPARGHPGGESGLRPAAGHLFLPGLGLRPRRRRRRRRVYCAPPVAITWRRP